MTCDKIMKGVMGGKTVNIPVQIMQSTKRSLHMPHSGQRGSERVPEGFRHSEQQPRGSTSLSDRSKSSEDSKQKHILTSSGFIIIQKKKSIHAAFLGFREQELLQCIASFLYQT